MRHANVALFVPNNGCPHRCSFCNQRTITGALTQPTPTDVVSAAETARASLGERTREAAIAFFGGSFTALDRSYMISLLDAALPYVKDGTFSGIRLSTRPDAVDTGILRLLKSYGVTAIELGAQSMDDHVLECNGRGHTAAQVVEASERIKDYGFTLGLQMMTGLYGDTPEGVLRTARRIAALQPQTVRIYPTIIMRGTELGEKYRNGEFRTLGLTETVALCARLLDFFEDSGISVIRLGLHASRALERDMLSGPYHPALRELCESRRLLSRMTAALRDGSVPKGKILVSVHPRTVSALIGQRRANLSALEEMGYSAAIRQDPSVKQNHFTIQPLE